MIDVDEPEASSLHDKLKAADHQELLSNVANRMYKLKNLESNERSRPVCGCM